MAECIRMLITVLGIMRGKTANRVSLIISLGMDQLCVFLRAWIMDCGFYAKTGIWPSSRGLTRVFAEVTHNHPEGVKGAMATADAIFLCRFYFGGYCREYEQSINDNPTECKRRIKDYIEIKNNYNLYLNLDEYSPNYCFITKHEEKLSLKPLSPFLKGDT